MVWSGWGRWRVRLMLARCFEGRGVRRQLGWPLHVHSLLSHAPAQARARAPAGKQWSAQQNSSARVQAANSTRESDLKSVFIAMPAISTDETKSTGVKRKDHKEHAPLRCWRVSAPCVPQKRRCSPRLWWWLGGPATRWIVRADHRIPTTAYCPVGWWGVRLPWMLFL